MADPRLIFTGGTLCSITGPDGLYVPCDTSLDEPAKNAGYDISSIAKPYNIDSIDFDIDTHYPQLLDAVMKVLDDPGHHDAVVCGGTDSLSWYGTLLTKDLMRRGYLQPDSNRKVIFLSAMRTIEKDPDHVQKILRAGKTLSTLPISGGFSVNAEHNDAYDFVVHDVCNHFDKISSELTLAFRSEAPLGYLIGDKFYKNYTAPAPAHPGKGRDYARVAPPLVAWKQDGEEVLEFMKTMGSAHPPFDAVILEGLPRQRDVSQPRFNMEKLTEAVRELTAKGVKVIFCNSLRYENEYLCPRISKAQWEDGYKKSLQQAGAKLVTALPRDAYIDAMLSTPRRTPQPQATDTVKSKQKLEKLNIRYVPWMDVMGQAVDVLAPKTNIIGFCALANGVMADDMGPVLRRNKSRAAFTRRFEYDGMEYVKPDGTSFIEGYVPHKYQAGHGSLGFTIPDSEAVGLQL